MSSQPLPTRPERSGIQINGEPFRLFFPAAILAGIAGVLLWPLFVWKVLPYYPAIAHPRIMMGGFFGGMIIGFLGTAGPRMLSVRPLANWELWTLFSLWGGAVVLAGFNKILMADLLTCIVFLFGFRCAIIRFLEREDLPPPGFAMVLVGLASGFTGSLLNLAISAELQWIPQPYLVAGLGRLLFYQAFILLPILGVAPFFFPRFGGLQSPHAAFADSRTPPPGWTPKALLAGAFGLMIVGTYVLEAMGHGSAGGILRTILVTTYIIWQIPLRFPSTSVGTLGRVVQVAVLLMVAGILLPAVLPLYRLGFLHVLFIGGFNLITLCVANWVIFGHSGIAGKARSKLRYVRWAAGLILFALLTRVIADIWPGLRMSHLAYAGIAWAAGVLLWARYIVPRVFKDE